MGICILTYKLFVLPTPETKSGLYQWFADVPIKINWDGLCVEIASSEAPIAPDITATYRALPGNLGIWYEQATARAWILLPLVPSPEMCARHEEIGDAWGRQFVPYMAITAEFNNTSKVKPKLNSIATALMANLPILEFTCETVLVDDAQVPSHQDFYVDYLKNGAINTQQFLER